MSSDAVAVLAVAPDEPTMVAALARAAMDLSVEQAPDGSLRLSDDGGRLWFTVDPPLLVQVHGEADRLLGSGPPVPVPGWWVECRADASVPGAAEAAHTLTRALARLCHGTVWRTGR